MTFLYRDRIPVRPPVGDCFGWLSHNLKACTCYHGVTQQARAAWLRPRSLHGILCAFGSHRWADDPGHWRRWCLECGHGNEAPPAKPAPAACRWHRLKDRVTWLRFTEDLQPYQAKGVVIAITREGVEVEEDTTGNRDRMTHDHARPEGAALQGAEA